MTSRIPTELRALRDLFHRCDPAPEHLVVAAYAAPSRTREWSGACSLELVADSAETPEPARVRHSGDYEKPRVLTFMMPGRVLEIGLTPTLPGMFRAAGSVINHAGHDEADGKVVVRHAEGECAGGLDDHGGFQVDDVPSGPVSVVFHPTRSSAPAVADWLVC